MNQRIQSLNTNQSQTASSNQSTTSRQRTINQRSASSMNTRTVGSTMNYATTRSPGAIHVGDVLKGEITDLRNNQISLTLEDNTVVRAQIADSSKYSIGQTGAFRLSDIAGNTLYLENISLGENDTEMNLINKALDEANLPPTSYNQDTVKALMDNLLPINRESIQQLMQQAYDFDTKDMNTLAVMKRLMMPLSKDSVQQFSNYLHEQADLVERVQSFSKDVPALLAALAQNSNADAVAQFGKEMLSIGLSVGNASIESKTPTIASLPSDTLEEIQTLLSDTALTEDIAKQIDQKTLSLQDAMTLLHDAILSGTLKSDLDSSELTRLLNTINQALEPSSANAAPVTEDFVKNILSLKEENAGSSATDTVAEKPADAESINPSVETNEEPQTQSRFALAGKFLKNFSESAKNALNDTLENIRSSNDTSLKDNSIPKTAIDLLAEKYLYAAREQDFLNTSLSVDDRNALLKSLQGMPISQSMLLSIASGEAATRDVLTVIYNTISLSDSAQVKELFASEPFQKLFSRLLQSNWTITPEQLKNGDLSKFYNHMSKQINQFESLIQNSLSGSDSKELGGYAHDMTSNIQFMKTLSETFSFFQMPLKLQNQDAHSELYVYTQKQKLRQNPERSSVLLHLDMEHLGTIDIKIDRNHNDILADFSLNDASSVQLFRINEDLLKNALNAQGFSCQMQFKQKEGDSPSLDHFINTKVNTHATDEMKRFSFDIRA